MKILLYGTCSFPFFFRELIRLAQERRAAIDWRILLVSWRHRELFAGILPDSSVFYVHEPLNELMKHGDLDVRDLKDYPASFFEDILADKAEPGQLRTKDKAYQLRNALAFHRLYKDYLTREKPDFIFFPTIETHEGKILFHLARQMGIPTLYNLNARNLGVSYFSMSPNEDLPPPAFEVPITPETRAKAKKFVEEFRQKPLPDVYFLSQPTEVDVPFRKRTSFFQKIWTRLPIGLWNLYLDAHREPHAPRSNPLWYQPRLEFYAMTYFTRRLKGALRKHYFDLHDLKDLPQNFIYFPLHFQPEATINSRAAYFLDQWRAIDLLLQSMPSHYYLVVKEHPAMKGLRPPAFYQEFKRRAGVLLADYDMPSIEMIRRAALTASITGTAAFEALIMGKPSLLLGKSFFSPWVHSLRTDEDLRQTLLHALSESAATVESHAVECIARFLSIGHNFILWDPYDPGIDPKYTMNRQNIGTFLDALLHHTDALRKVPHAQTS